MTESTSVARGGWKEEECSTNKEEMSVPNPEEEHTSKAWSPLSHKTSANKNKSETVTEAVYKLDRVIFPDNKWIKIWDLVVLICLFVITFILPYQVGVSGGYSLLVNIPWLVVNIIINSIFFVDTFLYFFRAYRNDQGQLIFNLRKIQKRYLRTYFVPNFISVLPFTIAFYIVGRSFLDPDDPGRCATTEEIQSSGTGASLSFIMIAGVLKLVRLVRAPAILSSSDVVTNFRLRHNSQVIQLISYVLLIVIVSHWFACIWCFVAFLEAQSFCNGLLENPNWIGGWFEGNYVDGSPNPIGLTQATDRYVLGLFWAIQTITSIGYGNISPVTTAEWWVGSTLQLCAGVLWAYVIGGLVGVAAGMQVRAEEYRNRCDRANELIKHFTTPEHVNPNDGAHIQDNFDNNQVAKRIRLYIHKQFKLSNIATCATGLSEEFPVFETLTPELQRAASILVVKPFLEAVPYLSSKYMSTEEQCQVAMKCIALDFSAGETVNIEDCMEGLGRGIFVFHTGCAFAIGSGKKKALKDSFYLLTTGMAFGTGKILVEDGHPASKGTLQFLTFAKVIFIPRSAALAALEGNERAWKGCARWIYLKTMIRDSAKKEI